MPGRKCESEVVSLSAGRRVHLRQTYKTEETTCRWDKQKIKSSILWYWQTYRAGVGEHCPVSGTQVLCNHVYRRLCHLNSFPHGCTCSSRLYILQFGRWCHRCNDSSDSFFRSCTVLTQWEQSRGTFLRVSRLDPQINENRNFIRV